MDTEGSSADAKLAFETGYAERSGMTVDALHKLGLFGEPCDCGDEFCQGWKMTTAQREASE